jgi:hypothetical protein
MIIKRLLKMSLIPVSVLCVSAVMLSISIYGYSRLSNETLIAEITFDKLVNNAHIAHVTTVDHCQTVDYHPIYGDQWRIDARFLKWKPWANLMGLDSNYRLDRLEGRYRNIVEENRGPHQAHDLAVENVMDIAKLNDYLGESNTLLDTIYGSSAYHGIDVDMRYLVYHSQSGLFARAMARERNVLVQDAPSSEIIKACGAQVGYWQALINSVFQADDGVADRVNDLF